MDLADGVGLGLRFGCEDWRWAGNPSVTGGDSSLCTREPLVAGTVVRGMGLVETVRKRAIGDRPYGNVWVQEIVV